MIASSLLALALAASAAGDRYLAAEGVVVDAVDAVPVDVTAAAWAKATVTRVPVAAQTTVTLPDKAANGMRAQQASTVTVRAVASAKELGVLVEWDDATADRYAGETDHYGDAVAVEVPVAFGAGKRLPYVGMGDAGSPVLVHMARATKGATVARHAVGAGFGSLTQAPDITWMKTSLVYVDKDKRWRALFVRPLVAADHSVDAALVPIAFAVWDGAHAQRGGNKLLSGWRVLRLPKRAVDAAYVDALAWGYGDGDVGDPARGKPMVEAMCLACHRIGDKAYGAPDAAPELTNVGVYASYGYLRESIQNPSAVLVPNLNKNRHQDRSKPRDDNGAYPSSGLGTFGVIGADGKPLSTMPPFAALPKEQLADVVAYLKSLGQTSPASASPASQASPVSPAAPTPSPSR